MFVFIFVFQVHSQSESRSPAAAVLDESSVEMFHRPDESQVICPKIPLLCEDVT